LRPEEFWNEYTLAEINEMLAAYVYREERKADLIAYGVSLAWGGKKVRHSNQVSTKSDRDHLQALMRGESDGTPIVLSPVAVTTIFPEARATEPHEYVPPPKTSPGVNIEADKAYLLKLNNVIGDIEKKKKKAG
jgi:hypothetical protein